MKEPFNPDSFFTIQTIKDILPNIEPLHELNFKEVSLNKELIKYNYEIVSSEYEDFMYEGLESYYEFEVDTIV